MAKWKKSTLYGDYKDPLQNHKFDDQLVLNTNTNELKVYKKLANRLNEAKWYFGKHIGSKRVELIQRINRKANDKRHLIKDYISFTKENKETKETENNTDENQ